VRNRITLPILLAVVVGLVGCATPAQEAAYAQHEMDRMMVVYGPACEKLGYQAHTDPWRNCIMQLSYKDDVQRYSYINGPYPFPYWAY
jgi:hypothetical protein